MDADRTEEAEQTAPAEPETTKITVVSDFI